MTANPYAPFLGNLHPRQVIETTAENLRTLFDTLDASAAERPPAPGKWNARQIVCHLADCEIAFAFRLRQALAQDDHVIQPFDQDRWAATYTTLDIPSALAVFTALRNWNLRFLAALPPESLAKPVTHPERGPMTIQTVVETMAGHDRNHLAQIETCCRPAAYNTSGGI